MTSLLRKIFIAKRTLLVVPLLGAAALDIDLVAIQKVVERGGLYLQRHCSLPPQFWAEGKQGKPLCPPSQLLLRPGLANLSKNVAFRLGRERGKHERPPRLQLPRMDLEHHS